MSKAAAAETPPESNTDPAKAEETTTPSGEAAATPPKQGGEPDKAAETTEKTFKQADIDRAVAKAKKETEKAVADAEARAKLSEDEKLKADNDGLRTQLRMRDAKDEVMEALTKAGARSAALMFNSIKGDLEFDEKTGKLTNLKDLLKDLQADYADQFGIPKPDGTIEGGAGQQAGGTKLTKEALAAMTPDEINKLDWEEVKKVMAAK